LDRETAATDTTGEGTAVIPDRAGPARGLVLTLTGVLLVACTAPGPNPAGSPQMTTGSPDGTAAPPVASPTATSPTAQATSDVPSPADAATDAIPPGANPPEASMAVEGGDPIVGALGSFTWRNAGSDAPWLRGAGIHVGSGEELEVTLGSPVAIAAWTAGRTPPGSLDGSSAIGLGEGRGGHPRFLAPPPGTWSVQVVVWFAANQGSAAYYWLVEVD
jgi:hypothetical protein